MEEMIGFFDGIFSTGVPEQVVQLFDEECIDMNVLNIIQESDLNDLLKSLPVGYKVKIKHAVLQLQLQEGGYHHVDRQRKRSRDQTQQSDQDASTSEIVQQKLTEIKQQRLDKMKSKAPLNKVMKQRTQEFTVLTAMKSRANLAKRFTQLKEIGKGQRKLIFNKLDSMKSVSARIIQEFDIDVESYDTVLLTADDEVVNSKTIFDYYLEHQKKYKGSTRLYIGLTPIWADNSEPDSDGIREVVNSELESSLNCHTNDDNQVQLTTDPHFVAYHADVQVLCFALQNKKTYKEVSSPSGEYMLIPEEDITDLQNFAVPDGAFMVDRAIRYYFNHINKLHNVCVKDLGRRGRIWLMPSYVAEQYRVWLYSLIDC